MSKDKLMREAGDKLYSPSTKTISGSGTSVDPINFPSNFHEYVAHLRSHLQHCSAECAEELFYSVVAEQTNSWEYWFDDKRLCLYYCSPACLQITGYTREQFFTEPNLINQIVHPDDLDLWQVHFSVAKDEDDVAEIQYRIVAKDKKVHRISHFCRKVLDHEGNPLGRRVTIRDITDQYNEIVERSRLAAAVDQAAESIVITDTSGNVVYANPAFETVTGFKRSEVLGKNPRILKSGVQEKSFYEHMWATINAGKVWSGHFVNRKKDGTFYEEEAVISPVLDNNGTIVNYVAVKRDVTHEMLLEKQLLQSQKMEALGTLAGGIAHDFNNILTAIKGYTELLLQNFPKDSNNGTYLKEVDKAANRARDLVNQVLMFSRHAETNRKPLNFSKFLQDMYDVIRGSIPETIPIDMQIAENMLPVTGDVTQLQQVLLNLCTNAYHAMEFKPGTIKIRLKSTVLSHDFVQDVPDLKQGEYIQLDVEDAGHGIDPTILDRIFDPFFTTKAVNKGTGLGLAVVHGIVKSHRGVLKVYSEVNKGTLFSVYLPRLVDDYLWEDEDRDAFITTRYYAGHESILLIDDEPFITKVTRISLERLGYNVTEAHSAKSAISLLEKNTSGYDIVVTDHSMPIMTGMDLAEVLHAKYPELPIIISIGIDETANMDSIVAAGIRDIIHKPFSSAELAKVIKRVLYDIK